MTTESKKIRYISIGVGIIISILLIIFGFGFIRSTFTRAEDIAPRDVVVGNITNTTVKVNWTTGKENQGVIEYGTSPTALNFYAPETKSTDTHAVDLTLLSPNTTYYFQVRIGDKKYDNAGVPWTFTTKGNDKTTGSDVSENTKITPTSSTVPQTQSVASSPTPTPISSVEVPASAPTTAPNAVTNSCTETDCQKIKDKIGKGCEASDYVKCIMKPTGSVTATPTPRP
jgi:hypothetical protein